MNICEDFVYTTLRDILIFSLILFLDDDYQFLKIKTDIKVVDIRCFHLE